MLLQETRVQPFPEYLSVHGDMRQEPFMADLIKASFDVPFENPWGTVPMAQHRMGLCHRIGTAAFSPKAIGMTISQTLRNGIDTEQVHSLHGSIAHRANPQPAPLALAFGNVHREVLVR